MKSWQGFPTTINVEEGQTSWEQAPVWAKDNQESSWERGNNSRGPGDTGGALQHSAWEMAVILPATSTWAASSTALFETIQWYGSKHWAHIQRDGKSEVWQCDISTSICVIFQARAWGSSLNRYFRNFHPTCMASHTKQVTITTEARLMEFQKTSTYLSFSSQILFILKPVTCNWLLLWNTHNFECNSNAIVFGNANNFNISDGFRNSYNMG